jgi:hypothetical protein
LKILTTEPVIGKYQQAAFPDDTKLKEVSSDLQNVIEKIKTITR